jgi:hypothetical protein
VRHPLLVPDWMSAQDLEQALLLLEDPHRPGLLPEALERLSPEDWENLVLAYRLLLLARERESLH